MFKSNRANISLVVVSVIFGALLSWGIQLLVPDILAWEFWLFLFTAVCCLIVCVVILIYIPALARHSTQKYEDVCQLTNEMQDTFENVLQHQAVIIPRESVYSEMAKTIRKAESQVAILTYYMYDWETGKRTFLPPEQEINDKDDFYEAIYETILKPEVEYIRIWQVPEERKTQVIGVMQSDPLHKREIELIQQVCLTHPEYARLIITGQYTTASFVLIDKRHLFFNVDFYDKNRNVWLSPYMIFIKDATGLAFSGLNSIIVRLTSNISN